MTTSSTRTEDTERTDPVSAEAARLPLAERSHQLVGSVIDSSTSLLAAQSHDIVRFAMGAPGDEAIPLADLAEAARGIDFDWLTYGATEGEPELIDELLAFLDRQGTPSSAERIVITGGGMQGLDLACKLFVDPGDLVVVESPTYTNGSATALSYGAELLEVTVDEDGMRIDELELLVADAGRAPKVIYVIPNFQNPSGTTLSGDRRRRLLELAHEWGSVIIDDDPYGYLRFEGENIPSFAELSPGDPLVFSVRTFSKIIAPGLRVGWVDADPSLRSLLISAKQAMDTCTNVPGQHLVLDMLRRGRLDTHLELLRPLYRERRDAMLAAFDRHLAGRVRTTVPEGGLFLWVTLIGLDSRTSTEQLFETALADGVAFIPGPALSPGGRFGDALRVCFASSTPDRIDEGVRRLAVAMDRARG